MVFSSEFITVRMITSDEREQFAGNIKETHQRRKFTMLTLTFKINHQTLDLMVRKDQRISDVLHILKEVGMLFFQIEHMLIYSERKKEYVNKLLTFSQAEVYTGDSLTLK